MKDGSGKPFDITDAYLNVAERRALRSGALYDSGYDRKKGKVEANAGSAIKSAAIAGALILASAIIPFLAPVLIPVAAAVGGWAAFQGAMAAKNEIGARKKKGSFNEELKEEIHNLRRQRAAQEIQRAAEERQRAAKNNERTSGTDSETDKGDVIGKDEASSPSASLPKQERKRDEDRMKIDEFLSKNDIGKDSSVDNMDLLAKKIIYSSGFNKMTPNGQKKFLKNMQNSIGKGGINLKKRLALIKT